MVYDKMLKRSNTVIGPERNASASPKKKQMWEGAVKLQSITKTEEVHSSKLWDTFEALEEEDDLDRDIKDSMLDQSFVSLNEEDWWKLQWKYCYIPAYNIL
jgi:hypothetical protein